MPGIDYRRLRETVGMAEVLALIGFEPRSRRGDQWRGSCSLHEGGTARSQVFSVNVAKGVFRCFKCQAAGNQLDLWAMVSQQPLFEAALDLCQRLRCDVPYLANEQRRGTRTAPSRTTPQPEIDVPMSLNEPFF